MRNHKRFANGLAETKSIFELTPQDVAQVRAAAHQPEVLLALVRVLNFLIARNSTIVRAATLRTSLVRLGFADCDKHQLGIEIGYWLGPDGLGLARTRARRCTARYSLPAKPIDDNYLRGRHLTFIDLRLAAQRLEARQPK